MPPKKQLKIEMILMTHIKKFTIDSNVFISAFVKEEKFYHFSLKFLEFIFEKNVIFSIPSIILFEVFQSLRKKGIFENKSNLRKFQIIFNSSFCRYIRVDHELFKFFKSFNFFESLRTSDAIIATSALATNSVLITWDKELLEKAHNAYTPEEFLQKFG